MPRTSSISSVRSKTSHSTGGIVWSFTRISIQAGVTLQKAQAENTLCFPPTPPITAPPLAFAIHAADSRAFPRTPSHPCTSPLSPDARSRPPRRADEEVAPRYCETTPLGPGAPRVDRFENSLRRVTGTGHARDARLCCLTLLRTLALTGSESSLLRRVHFMVNPVFSEHNTVFLKIFRGRHRKPLYMSAFDSPPSSLKRHLAETSISTTPSWSRRI
jgi:hypothetical protein